MPAGITEDGSHATAQQHGDIWYGTPFEHDPQQYLMMAEFWQERAGYAPPTFSTVRVGALGNYYFAGDTNFQDLAAGVASFQRTYAKVPATRSEYESFVYSFQVIITTISTEDGTSYALEEIPETVNSRVQYDYIYSTTPSTITLDLAPRVVLVNGTPRYIGSWDTVTAGSEMLAEDATLSCWKGNIYERKQRFIKQRAYNDY